MVLHHHQTPLLGVVGGLVMVACHCTEHHRSASYCNKSTSHPSGCTASIHPNYYLLGFSAALAPKFHPWNACSQEWRELGRAGESWEELGKAGESWGELRRAGESWGHPSRDPSAGLRQACDTRRKMRLLGLGYLLFRGISWI